MYHGHRGDMTLTQKFLKCWSRHAGNTFNIIICRCECYIKVQEKSNIHLFRSRKPCIPKYVKLSIPEELHCIHSVQNCWSIFQFWDVPNCSSNLKTQKHKVLSFQKLLRCSGYDRKQRLKIQGHRWKLMPSQFGCEYKYEG